MQNPSTGELFAAPPHARDRLEDAAAAAAEHGSFHSITSADQEFQSIDSGEGSSTPPPLARTPEPSRKWRDIFWLAVFVLHLLGLGVCLAILGMDRFRGLNRFKKLDRLSSSGNDKTEFYWPMYATAAAIGSVLAWLWLSLLCLRADQMVKIVVHSVTTYLAVIAVFCFWHVQIFWGIVFAVGAFVQFLYSMSVMDRLPFTMLVLRKSVGLVWAMPSAIRVSYGFLAVMLMWMVIWTFGVSGVVASGMERNDGLHWWVLVVLSVSLFWTGAIVCNTLHVVVAGLVTLVLRQGAPGAAPMPRHPLLRTLRHAVTTSLGSICYGSLFTAAIRTLRWAIRGLRSQIGKNECLLCCVDFLFNMVETLVRFFNKYAYVQVAAYGKGYNHAARDAWELFQLTGVEALIAYDLSGAVLLMGIVLGGLITGTCVGIWVWFARRDRVVVVGATSMLMGMILVGLTLVVVESTVTSIYVCYAEDPALISRWDPDFAEHMTEILHQRLQHRSGRAVPTHVARVQLPKPLPEVRQT